MQISVDVSKRDLFLLSLHVIPRLRGNWVFFAVLALLIFCFVYFTRSPLSERALLVALVASIAAAFAGALSALLINTVTMLLKLQPDSPSLGRRAYLLGEEGVHVLRRGSSELLPWRDVSAISRAGGMVLLRAGRHQFHFLPRRAFASSAAFDAFYLQARSLAAAGGGPR